MCPSRNGATAVSCFGPPHVRHTEVPVIHRQAGTKTYRAWVADLRAGPELIPVPQSRTPAARSRLGVWRLLGAGWRGGNAVLSRAGGEERAGLENRPPSGGQGSTPWHSAPGEKAPSSFVLNLELETWNFAYSGSRSPMRGGGTTGFG